MNVSLRGAPSVLNGFRSLQPSYGFPFRGLRELELTIAAELQQTPFSLGSWDFFATNIIKR